MKKSICFSVVFLLLFSYYGATQCCMRSKTKEEPHSKTVARSKTPSTQFAKSTPANKWIPYVESSYQLGLCGESFPVAFTAGAEKKLSKHLSVGADVHGWNTHYQMYCDNVFSKGNYTSLIPAVKLNFYPSRQYKGFFVGAGIGYAFARDRGTEQTYTYTPATGKNNLTGSATPGNWDFNTVATSIQWGLSFKINRVPVTFVNTNYLGKSTVGYGPLATGVGLRVGLAQVARERKSSCSSSRIRIVERSCILQKAKTGSSQQKSKSNCSSRCGSIKKI
jgi:hypothetical protein